MTRTSPILFKIKLRGNNVRLQHKIVLPILVLTLVLLSACASTRQLNYTSIDMAPATGQTVSVDGLNFSATFDKGYKVPGFETKMKVRFIQHLQAVGMRVVPKGQTRFHLKGTINFTENEHHNGWLAMTITGSTLGGGAVIAGAVMLASGGSLVPALVGVAVIPASLASPDKSFDKTVSADITLLNYEGKKLFSKQHVYKKEDRASTYFRISNPNNDVNQSVIDSLDNVLSDIAMDLITRLQ